MTHVYNALNGVQQTTSTDVWFPVTNPLATPVPYTVGFTNQVSDWAFSPGDRDALLRAIRVGARFWMGTCQRNGEGSTLFGPDGVKIKGGFWIEVIGTPAVDIANFAIIYDVL
jgi:hypothetical protein